MGGAGSWPKDDKRTRKSHSECGKLLHGTFLVLLMEHLSAVTIIVQIFDLWERVVLEISSRAAE